MPEMKSLTLNDKTYDCFVDGVARSSVIVNSASGVSITVTDSSGQALMGLNIYGKSTQAGTPTPTAPVSIDSVGDDGDVAVTVGADTMGLMLANGLRGLPATNKSPATYTDESGAMWYADEVDLARGVCVRRTQRVQLLPTWAWKKNNAGTEIYAPLDNIPGVMITENSPVICTHFSHGAWGVTKAGQVCFGNGSYPFLGVSTASFPTVDALVEWLTAQTEGVFCLIPLKTPVETPLTASEIEAYKALRTNKPSTTIINDSGAYMKLEYIADPKAYIDNKISGAILTATAE